MPIDKHLVEFHPSVAVIYSPSYRKLDRLFMSVYEKGYPQRAYRNKPNTLGGNPSIIKGYRDYSPLSTLERELKEEINPDHPEELKFGYTELWAPREDIKLIRDSVLTEIKPVRDYFVDIKRIGSPEEKMNLPGSGIFSVFYTDISQATLDCLEYNINTMRRTITEGYAGTFTIDQLVKAAKIDPYQISCAHLTPIILNDMFKSNIPHPRNITVDRTDKVRNSYEEYLYDNDLEHEDSWLKI